MRLYFVPQDSGSFTTELLTAASQLLSRGAHILWNGTCRAMVALGTACAACFDRIAERFERSRNDSRDTFFAGAVDLRDLEYRVHYYERTGLTHY